MIFDKEVMQVIVSKEAMLVTNVSVKESNMEGVWRIEDLYECASTCNSIWSSKWEEMNL